MPAIIDSFKEQIFVHAYDMPHIICVINESSCLLRLHAYLVLNETNIADIFGP